MTPHNYKDGKQPLNNNDKVITQEGDIYSNNDEVSYTERHSTTIVQSNK